MNDQPGVESHNDATEESGVSRRTRRGGLRRRFPSRQRRLVSTAALPALFTILNGLAGFASIHFATKDAMGEARPENLTIAAWMIFAGMLCDMLDGRIARITRKTSEFGEQLDSLCDMITFGVAPAILMARTVAMVLHGQVDRLEIIIGGPSVERVILCVAGVYAACAALRLARFNVETDVTESSHMTFRGLPSPGAAATVAALVLLFADLVAGESGWRSSVWILATVSIILPVATLAMALLMVSRFQYPHVVNQYIRSKKSFGFLVKLVVVILPAAILALSATVAAITIVFSFSGPVMALWRRIKPERPQENRTDKVDG